MAPPQAGRQTVCSGVSSHTIARSRPTEALFFARGVQALPHLFAVRTRAIGAIWIDPWFHKKLRSVTDVPPLAQTPPQAPGADDARGTS